MPKLSNVQVFILGVDGAWKPTAFWQSSQSFWEDYLRARGALLRSYTALREIGVQ